MSVLIKGMEMPTSCADCELAEHYERYGNEHHCPFMGWYADYANCPLISVPPHGRLIDADALEAHGDCLSKLHVDFDSPAGHRVWRECVPFDDIPTIIPAEEGE